MSKPFRTRFAPSPTGLLHLGHAYSALLAYQTAKAKNGDFILRIEDIDTTRCRPKFEEAIYEDLHWLGLEWETPVRRQSDHFSDYQEVLNKLENLGVTYPCFCTRADIKREIEGSPSAPHGPEGALYPGTCRGISAIDVEKRKANGDAFAIRLDAQKAQNLLAEDILFKGKGKLTPARPASLGDVVLARKDTPTSYHLSVVVDDHLQGITHIIRGVDLEFATHLHRLLQALLNYNVPTYHHHPLLVGADGKRFAKRDKSLTIKSLRDEGKTPDDLIGLMEANGGTFSELPF